MIRHRTFRIQRVWLWPIMRVKTYREEMRAEVEEFVNSEVGSANVISVSESGSQMGVTSITVWYRDETSP